MRTLNSILRTFESRKVLAIAAVLMFLILNLFTPGTVLAFQTYMPGIVRDFQRSHPDFDVTPLDGYGHYAGNIAEIRNASGKPDFTGTGFLVGSEWTDRNLNPIAPHLYNPVVTTVSLVNAPTLVNNGVVDSYDSSAGSYDAGTASTSLVFATGSTMPTVTEPTGLPPLIDTVTFSGAGSTTISTDIHCNIFQINTSHELIINGDVTLLVEQSFHIMDNASVLNLTSGSSLTIYIKGTFLMEDQSRLNATASPSLVQIINLGTGDIVVMNQAQLSAEVISPNGSMLLLNGADFFGTYIGESIEISNASGFHAVQNLALSSCGVMIDDIAGVASGLSTGGITSAATFDQWFSDVLGTNLSVPYQMPMVLGADGVYRIGTSGAFYPIDNLLFGNEGAIHNYFFTYTFQASFIYAECTNQYFNLQGSDDLWLFINDQLVIDLSGVLTGTNQIVELDRLGLTDGETYTTSFFYTNRQSTLSEFDLETNIVLIPSSIPLAGTGAFD